MLNSNNSAIKVSSTYCHLPGILMPLTDFLLGTQKCRRALVVEHRGGGNDAKLKGRSGVCTYTHS